MHSVNQIIEKRAYQLFLERGGIHGYHIQDWVQAEKEIQTQLQKKPSSEATVTRKAPVSAPVNTPVTAPVTVFAKTAAPAKKKAAKKKAF